MKTMAASLMDPSLLRPALSGLRADVDPERQGGAVLLLEGAVLALATVQLHYTRPSGIPLAAMACGLQNALASSYFGLVIRTTHVTGVITVMGLEGVQYLLWLWDRTRGRRRAWRRSGARLRRGAG